MSNGGIIGPVNLPNTVSAPSSNQAFTSSGSFNIPANISSLDVLVVAGGAGGGPLYGTGGGGAGGLILYPGMPVSGPATVPITIGAGGNRSNNGSDSIFNYSPTPLTAKGGGTSGPGPSAGTPGGSGGGAGGSNQYFPAPSQPGGTATQPTQPGASGTYGYGSNGGPADSNLPVAGAGGGGGATSAGGSGGNGGGGNGGNGLNVAPIFGAAPQPFYAADVSGAGPTSTGIFAGGGGGSVYQASTSSGGPGGGGRGGSQSGNQAVSGTTNSGGGGGGIERVNCGAPPAAGLGGSGIVVVKTPAYSFLTSTSGVWSTSDVYNFKKAGQWTS
jgi:hypothetical protein